MRATNSLNNIYGNLEFCTSADHGKLIVFRKPATKSEIDFDSICYKEHFCIKVMRAINFIRVQLLVTTLRRVTVLIIYRYL